MGTSEKSWNQVLGGQGSPLLVTLPSLGLRGCSSDSGLYLSQVKEVVMLHREFSHREQEISAPIGLC